MPHVDFDTIRRYLETKCFPENVKTLGEKANVRRAAKLFELKDGRLVYTRAKKDGSADQLTVITQPDAIRAIIQEVHQGSGASDESKALRAHQGCKSTIEIISKRFYWRSVHKDVYDYIRCCDTCQMSNRALSKEAPSMNPVPIQKKVMSQVGVDICSLRECGGYAYVVLAVDYFTKWSEGKAIREKSALEVARFLYEVVCRHGCFDIQINDQGREFVNGVADEFHRLVGVEQHITSSYHPQANGLVERQNRTVKDKLMKTLEGEPGNWVAALDGVLFAHRTAVQRSTGFSPFFLLYGRDPKLPVDSFMKDVNAPVSSTPEENEVDEFNRVATAMKKVKEITEERAMKSIKRAQERQKRGYEKRHSFQPGFKKGDKVLLRNLRRDDRKGGKTAYPWKGPYTVAHIFKNNTCSLLSGRGETLRQKHHLRNIKRYVQQEKESEGSAHVTPAQAITACSSMVGNGLVDADLTVKDRNIIMAGQWLNDKIIDVSQDLIKQKYGVGGLQSSLLCQIDSGYLEPAHPSVQIHFDKDRSHFVTSSSCRGRVEVVDSLCSGVISPSVQRQLLQCYKKYISNHSLQVFLADGQQQGNGSDCGVFAIANAVELLDQNGNLEAQFDQTSMRAHLLDCIERRAISCFPKNMKISAEARCTNYKLIKIAAEK